MKAIKVLHIASFNGNIGDNANHSGFLEEFSKNTGFDFDYDQWEMRDFYFNTKKRFFDAQFIADIKAYDLVVIGGGNFFEIAFEESLTGCTINLDPELLKELQTPIFFNGIGFDPSRGVSECTIKKFELFFEKLLSHPYCFVSVRNDGSLQDLKKFYSDKFINTTVVADGGFFIQKIPQQNRVFNYPNKKNYIAINLAGDTYEKRFLDKSKQEQMEYFLAQMADFVSNYVLQKKQKVVFTCHVLMDYFVTLELLSRIDNAIIREYVVIAPYLQNEHYLDIFNIYQNASIVVSNRFHANVCSIALQTPVVGLSGYPKVKIPKLHDELGIKESIVDIYSKSFTHDIREIVEKNLTNTKNLKEQYAAIVQELKIKNVAIHIKIKAWYLGLKND